MTSNRSPSALHCLALSCLTMLSLDASAAADPGHGKSMSANDKAVFSSEGMQSAHPDFRWRMAGLYELDRGELDLAQTYLTRAARYADKPAQGMLAELLWTGRGVTRNAAQAYAWMDLAAERGYVMFVSHREKYWAALTPQERSAALEFGRALYAEYGDDVAKPRLERVLARARRNTTGSRIGAVGSIRVFEAPEVNPYGGGGIGLPRGNRFLVGKELPRYYDDKYWRPAQYWAWQDRLYRELPLNWKLGEVDVGDPKQPSDEGTPTRKPDPNPV